jgi:hypothetical protein
MILVVDTYKVITKSYRTKEYHAAGGVAAHENKGGEKDRQTIILTIDLLVLSPVTSGCLRIDRHSENTVESNGKRGNGRGDGDQRSNPGHE